jgi:DnaJ-class molecular chaperone
MTTIIFTFDDEVECPECAGVGECEYDFEVIDHLRGGEIVSLVRECRMCDGNGVIYVEGEPEDDEQ